MYAVEADDMRRQTAPPFSANQFRFARSSSLRRQMSIFHGISMISPRLYFVGSA